jgi:Arc/MetJ-type ribon-helix-helix transcriptional regulator
MISSYYIIIHLINKNMTTISVPLPPNMVEYIENEVRVGNFENKAQLVRKALEKFRENEAIETLLQAEKEITEGKLFKGDLDELVKKLRK